MSVGQQSSLSHASSKQSLASFCSVNELEKSMSYIERTAKKLLPILHELKKRMIPDKKKKRVPTQQSKRGNKTFKANEAENEDSGSDDEMLLDLAKAGKEGKRKGPAFDLKNILGYLNQGENL